ncbi:MAG TPA: DNA-directed RNA polymerase subunit alpha [Candidatus Levybacteria bacterium]|nr:DNA-directed RNA polymerase subunit alpha [Candidatus Levybacteria bacterium]
MIEPNFNVTEEINEAGYTRFIVEPLEPGFGHTLGVALRRVMLNNIEGAAVTSVKIEGVKHMFSTLPGLKEDIIEFILNIKTLRIKLAEGQTEARMTLSKTGSGKVHAKDIEVSEGVEIIDPEHYLGSLSDKSSKLEVEFTVERGLGYSLSEERKVSTVGVIPIDAIYSPIQKVNYKVEQTRVGRQTNYDKLIFEVWTDGTVNAREAFDESSRILVSYFSMISNPKSDTQAAEQEEGSEAAPQLSDDLMKMTVDELDLPTRIYNSLRNAGIETVGDMLNTPRKELMTYRNLGAKSLSIIDESLAEKGITYK